MADFIQEYFVNPILYQDKYPPYNVYNTIVYAALALIAVYFLFRFFRKHGVKINQGFFKAVIPYVVFGSILRIAEDGHLVPRVVELAGIQFYPFVTPGIYLLTFLLMAFAMLLAKLVYGSSEKFAKVVQAFGVALCVGALVVSLPALLLMKNPFPFAVIFALALAVWFAFKIIWAKRGLVASFQEQSVVFAQALDGAATFVGVTFLGYSEQHVVGNAIFSLFGGPWAFLLIKIIFSFVVVEVVRKEKLQEEEKTYLYLLITVLGLGPGLRDALRMLAGV